MVSFKEPDKKRFKDKNKVATFRAETCSIKGGKNYLLCCERIKGGFGTSYFYKPIECDLRTIPFNIIVAAGFNNINDYLNESYNKNNDSYIRKLYFMKDIELKI